MALVLLRIADLGITAYYTPDLASEWNPLVSVCGANWGTLIFTQILIVSFTATMMFFWFRRSPVIIEPSGLNLSDFMRAYFTGTHEHGSKTRGRADLRSFLLIPDRNDPAGNELLKLRINRHLIFNGWLFMIATMLISLFAIVHNLLLIAEVVPYMLFVESWYELYFPAVFIAGIAASAGSFAAREYRAYRDR